VVVQSAEANFTATLRVGAQAGINVGETRNFKQDLLPWTAENVANFSDTAKEALAVLDYDIGGGIQVGVYADVASFRTGLKASTSDDADCDVEIFQEYAVALAATAGAQVTFGTATHGPTRGTTRTVFIATMASTCIGTLTSNATTTSTTDAPDPTADTLSKRQDSDDISTTTVKKVTKHTAALCPATMTGQCAVSELELTTSTETLTATITLSGSEDLTSSVVFPTSTTLDAIPFGASANTLPTLTGSPTLHTLEPTDGFINRVVDNVQDRKTLAIGLGVGIGVGVPVLAVIAVLIL
jgi:hypothetical protein